ncbi:hypothetical protein AMECASPLE_014585 [Ameca splendens]|uniref:Uncharacterized protein n=1 Tax=Ameca splendens TaxID=208324 RepID=A0ABV1A7Z3_9TELE
MACTCIVLYQIPRDPIVRYTTSTHSHRHSHADSGEPQLPWDTVTEVKLLYNQMQHLAANTEEPKLPQDGQSALSLLVEGFIVTSPLQSVVQVNTEVFILLHHLNLFSHDGNSV